MLSRLAVSLLCLALLAPAAIGQHDPHKPADKHADPHHPAKDAAHDAHKGFDAHKEGEHAHKEHSALDHVMDSPEIEWFGGKTIHLLIPRFILYEILAALIIVAIYMPMARRLESGEPPRGGWDNAFESLLTFVRDQIAKPNIGPDADRYVPFLWTLFLFILVNNLLGMVPFLGSATASIYVTGALALIVFFAIHGSAITAMGRASDHDHGHHDGHDHGHAHHDHGRHHAEESVTGEVLQRGTVRYIQSLWPHIDVPWPMGYFVKPLVFVIEIIGILVRNGVLAVRLFANMFAGHMVIATILLFIKAAADLDNHALFGTITIASVLGILALSLLELFVAFLQAYIFTFLTSLFMGMAITPQH